MRSNRKILAGVVLLAAVLLIYGIYSFTANRGGGSTVAVNTDATPIARPASLSSRSRAVAAFDIPARSIITPDMLKMVDYNGPASDVFVTDLSQATGFITRVPIPAGAPLQRQNDLIGHISEVGIAGALRPGTRALVIPIGNKPTLHDLVKIGNYVDILASFDSQEARTIVQNVRVLAVDIYGNDFPSVNAAMRGPFKADSKSRGYVPPPAPAPGEPAAPAPEPTPTPTAAPANAVRPDPAITLEVTPQQAAAIQLAMQSGAALDYLLLPALPGNLSSEPVLSASTGTPGANGTTGTTGGLKTVSVTKAQLAPYAERKRTQGGTPSRSGGSSGSDNIAPPRFTSLPEPPQVTPVMPDFPTPTNELKPQDVGNVAPAAPPTYQIPIYADGKTVRTETVLTPQE